MHFIYFITNLLNNKIYIGQTNNPSLRWSQHKSNAKYNRGRQAITRAIIKYGIDNFKFEVITSCETQIEADKSEEEFIAKYSSRDPNKGYNIHAGGNTTPRTKHYLKLISEGLKKYYKDNFNHMKGKKLPKEWKENISKSSIGKPGTNCGKKFNHDWVIKISKSKSGKQYKSRRKFSEDIEKDICNLYVNEQMSMYALGKKFSCNRNLIADILQRNNIDQRQSNYTGKSNKKLFSHEKELEICEEYKLGNISRNALAKKVGCSKTTIREILLRHNIKF